MRDNSVLSEKYNRLAYEMDRAKSIVNNNSVLFAPKVMKRSNNDINLLYPLRERPQRIPGVECLSVQMRTVPLDVMVARSNVDYYSGQVHFKVMYQNEMVGYGISRDFVADHTTETIRNVMLDGMNKVLTDQIVKTKKSNF